MRKRIGPPEQARLIREDRTCCCCGTPAKPGALAANGCRMCSITSLLYRPGRKIKATRNVTVCEACLILALAGGESETRTKVFRTVIERLTSLYNSILQEAAE